MSNSIISHPVNIRNRDEDIYTCRRYRIGYWYLKPILYEFDVWLNLKIFSGYGIMVPYNKL